MPDLSSSFIMLITYYFVHPPNWCFNSSHPTHLPHPLGGAYTTCVIAISLLAWDPSLPEHSLLLHSLCHSQPSRTRKCIRILPLQKLSRGGLLTSNSLIFLYCKLSWTIQNIFNSFWFVFVYVSVYLIVNVEKIRNLMAVLLWEWLLYVSVTTHWQGSVESPLVELSPNSSCKLWCHHSCVIEVATLSVKCSRGISSWCFKGHLRNVEPTK